MASTMDVLAGLRRALDIAQALHMRTDDSHIPVVTDDDVGRMGIAFREADRMLVTGERIRTHARETIATAVDWMESQFGSTVADLDDAGMCHDGQRQLRILCEMLDVPWRFEVYRQDARDAVECACEELYEAWERMREIADAMEDDEPIADLSFPDGDSCERAVRNAWDEISEYM